MGKSKGFAKIEFIANLDEIKALHRKGFNKKTIYDLLIKGNKITMGYDSFCSYRLDGVRRKRPSYNPDLQEKEIKPVYG